MKQIKNYRQIPSDFQLLLHLSDIQDWKKLPKTIAEVEISFNGFHYGEYEDKKIVVVK